MQSKTLQRMISRLLQVPGLTLSGIARQVGVHEETLRKLYQDENYKLVPAKKLALIKFYCAKQNNKCS